jgi:hypothetical protein
MDSLNMYMHIHVQTYTNMNRLYRNMYRLYTYMDRHTQT